VKERPILFSAPMIQAILAGRKTQTRRIINFDIRREARLPSTINFRDAKHNWRGAYDMQPGKGDALKLCPYGVVGDRLWVKETFGYAAKNYQDYVACYRATEPGLPILWKPSIFMPRRHSRILLEITGVRVQRLQDISGKEILAEGAVTGPHTDEFGRNPVSAFDGKVYMDLISLWAKGWDSINAKKAPFASNPYVWVIAFKRLDP
jgi:hypothetical protein